MNQWFTRLNFNRFWSQNYMKSFYFAEKFTRMNAVDRKKNSIPHLVFTLLMCPQWQATMVSWLQWYYLQKVKIYMWLK